MKLGVVDLSDPRWSAGYSFTKMMAYSLAAAVEGTAAEVVVISNRTASGPGLGMPRPSLAAPAPVYAPGEHTLRRLFRLPPKSALFHSAREHGISVLLPIFDFEGTPSCGTIGWIPDFQQTHCPQYFTAGEIENRARRNRRLAETCDLVLLSSQAAGRDFAAAFPAQARKARVIPFPSLFAFEPPARELAATLAKYHLPEKFLLVANQFWPHKNHAVVIRAIAELAARGLRLPVVLTGLPLNFLDPCNQTISDVLQAIAAENLTGQIYVLGMVAAADFSSLLRSAAAIIQPSRFEGWNTTVEDAKALGRPLLCADTPVLREQAPAARGFFPCDECGVLAALLERVWPALTPGPDFAAEAAALAGARDFAQAHGRALLRACEEVAAARSPGG